MSNFKIYYSGRQVSFGQKLDIRSTTEKPNVLYTSNYKDYYTIIMVDPDAPYPENPIYKYYLHWIIINNNVNFVAYNPPSPPSDSKSHRYFIILLKQKSYISPNKINDRKNFDLDAFIQMYDLQEITYSYFVTHPVSKKN